MEMVAPPRVGGSERFSEASKGALARGSGGASGGGREVEALSRKGSEGKPTELCVRTKPSSREEVASGSKSGCEECEECEDSEDCEGDRRPKPK